MTILWELLSNSGLAQALAALLAGIGVIAGAWFGGKRSAKRAVENKALKDKIKREGKADEALTDEKRAGGDNVAVVERLHDRDRKW